MVCVIKAKAGYHYIPTVTHFAAVSSIGTNVNVRHQSSWLALLADLPADPKNQLLVSSTWSRRSSSIRSAFLLPLRRIHGLYTGAKHIVNAGGPHAAEVIVCDRTRPLMSCALDAFLQSVGRPGSNTPMRSVHHPSTDRKYQTCASFRAVVFIPGDVEQMAIYEFHSMEIPVFVPADPGRYMWPQLPEPASSIARGT